MAKLKKIDLRGNKLGHRGLKKIAESIKDLKKLKEFLFDIDSVKPESIDELHKIIPKALFEPHL